MLRVSATLDYALRAAVLLARAEGRPMTVAELAASEGLPVRFLATTLAGMRESGLLESRRGGTGGFWLSRPPSEISLADLIRSVDGAVVELGAVQGSSAAHLWHGAAGAIEASLSRVSLAELAAAGSSRSG